MKKNEKFDCGKFAVRPLCALLSVMLAPDLLAADEDLYFASLPVVASVSRLPQPLSEAPGAVTVIDRDMIRASGARNFADLLRLVPGFQVTPPSQEGAVVAYHGLSNEEYTPRVQVLMDGRSLYSPLFRAGVNWNLLPVALEDIERIEVSRGSNSVSYGSSAFLGVINIITVDASQARGWLFSANHGNQSIDDETLRWGGRIGSADVRFTYQQFGDGGLRKMCSDFDEARKVCKKNWFDPHDSRHAKLVDLRADIPLSERDELRVSINQASDISQFGRPGTGAAVQFGDPGDPFRDLSQSSTAVSAEWRRSLADGEEVQLRFSRVEDWASGRYKQQVSYTDVNGVNIAPYTTWSNTGGGGKSVSNQLEFQHIFAPWHQTRLVWGGSVQTVQARSQFQFFTNDWKDRSNYRIFGNLEWRPDPKWLFNFGSSVEQDSISGGIVDPRVSASYHVTPENTLRAVASRAHRAPSLYEALGDTRSMPIGATSPMDISYLAAPGIKPERVDTVEFGYLGEFRRLGASVDLRWFHESIPNRLVFKVPYALPAGSPDSRDPLISPPGVDFILRTDPRNSGNYPYGRADTTLNLERVSIQGYEYQLRWQPFEATRLMYGHAYIRTYSNPTLEGVVADVRGANTDKIFRQTRESAPRHSTSAMAMQRLPYDLEASVMYYKSAYMYWRRNSTVRPYERVDWRLAWPFRLAGARAEVAYTAQIANHPQEVRLSSRVATEMHWVSLRLEY